MTKRYTLCAVWPRRRPSPKPNAPIDRTAGCPVPQHAALAFVAGAAPRWQATLGPDLLGAYLMGSLAHGGFSRRYSDIDIALTTETGLSAGTLEAVRRDAVAFSAEWGPRVSLFWADRRFTIGRFPPLDRVDYLDHAAVLVERERVEPPRPSRDEIRAYLRGAPFANWSHQARGFAAAPALAAKDHKAYLRTLLYPARLCYSWLTGRMGSNDDAVAYLGEERPPGLDLDLIVRALHCRQADADPDDLFAARTALPAQVDACAALLGD